MTITEGGLRTLAFRIDPDQLGDLTLYPLTPGFAGAWDQLSAEVRRRVGRDEIAPSYAGLAAALTAVTGQPVCLFPASKLSRQQVDDGAAALLATTAPIDPWLLTTATRAFEQMSLGNNCADSLAPELASVKGISEPLAKHVQHRRGTVSAPAWIYAVARWNLAAQLASQPLLIDGHLPIRLRLDTEGNLLAWDDPITRTWNLGPCHAMVYLETAIVTLPGAADLYLRLDSHVSRQPYKWWGVKHAWIGPGGNDPDRPILHLPVRSAWPAKGWEHPEYGNFAAAIVEQCQLDPMPALPDQPPSELGRVRLIGKPDRHPIGKGPGARTIFQTRQHVLQVLGIPDLTYRRTGLTVTTAATGQIPAAAIDAAIIAVPDGQCPLERLRLVCLYDSQNIRRRMTDALAAYSLTGPGVLAGLPDGSPADLTGRLSVVFHHAPVLLAHGDHARDFAGVPGLAPAEQGAVIALAETSWEPGSKIEHDAKPMLRAALGKRGVVAQFLNSQYIPKKPRRRKDGTITEPGDHPAEKAVRDLLRQAGVIDNRLAVATARSGLASALTRPATLVGLHIRQHTPRRINGRKPPNRLVVQMVAIHAVPDQDAPWPVQMYDDAAGWISYREANARYYAGDIGKEGLGRFGDKAQLVRDYVDQALASLPKTEPLVVFVDAQAGRGLWSGLNHDRFGDGPLPGSGCGHPDLAVVRCASGDLVPRPSHRDHGARSADPYKPSLPRASLYEHTEGDVTSWLLAQPSRAHRGSTPGSRAGTDHTRWTLPEARSGWMSGDWHALTAIEIAVPQAGSWQPRDLAALTARLCHQAASWDDRTVAPTPLHLAKASDNDHPGHPPDEDAAG